MDSSDKDKRDAKKPRRGCIGIGWWVEIPIGILLLILLAAIGMPVQVPDGKSREAEVKINLHNIQLSIERYAVDHDGLYPEYLIGGQGKHSVFTGSSPSDFSNIEDCPDIALLADPLLRAGFIESYPKNPFAINGAAIHRFQENVGDPLRNGTEAAKLHGTRFGPYCTISGNVLADFRYTEFTVFGDDGAQSVFPTHADVEYPFFDLWEHPYRPKPFLPGEFFYKAGGVIGRADMEEAEWATNMPLRPTATEIYMLGAYGSIRTKGKDILGPEPTITFFVPQDGTDSRLEYVPSWTRSTMKLQDDQGRFLGSPYGGDDEYASVDQIGYGSPNGIPDGIILVILPGEHLEGPRD